jgi:hypothetical protein
VSSGPAAAASAVGSFTDEANGGSNGNAGNANSAASQDEGAQELASLVWNFVSTAGSLVQELDTEVNDSVLG